MLLEGLLEVLSLQDWLWLVSGPLHVERRFEVPCELGNTRLSDVGRRVDTPRSPLSIPSGG